jgi:hypothetical protein
MKIRSNFGTYNENRYGPPWGAKLTIGSDLKFEYDFCGVYTGADGCAGDVIMDVEPGTYLAVGQKDYRGQKSYQRFYLVEDAGTLAKVTRVEVYEALLAPTAPTGQK